MAAMGLVVLAHLLAVVLLGIERRMLRRQPVQDPLQFVSVWPDLRPPPVQPQAVVPARTKSARTTSVSRAIAPATEPPATANIPPAPAPAPPDEATLPPVDWVKAGQQAAARFAENYGKPDTFSPPPNTDLPAKLCAPRTFDKATQAEMDELLPPPREPPPAFSGTPPGSVMMPGGVRVGIIGGGIALGGKRGGGVPIDLSARRPESSVADPNTCD